jgi:2-keto-4-pentenoate hydratase/2-oxohepta-3-ene-1,7-dioic acid hydratase in catechol pathway
VRIARCAVDDAVDFAVVESTDDGEVVALLAAHPFGAIQFSGVRHRVEDVRLLAPMLPSKIIAVARNYADHAKEMGGEVPEQPMIFLKPSTSVIGPNDAILLPRQSEQVDYEGELAVVIGSFCREVDPSRAGEVILGYTVANDVTARDLQRSDGQWSRAKGFDTFCPLGPWIETGLDVTDLAIETTVNADVRQHGRTSQLVHSIAELIAFVSAAMTLLPGDVILTGTPAGVGALHDGDTVAVSIEGIGTLSNRVMSRA